MRVDIMEQPFSAFRLVEQYQSTLPAGKFGATSVFVGTMRDFNEGSDVLSMHLEHYPEMTQGSLERSAQAIVKEHELMDIYIAHRVGNISPNDDIVVVASWSAHRKNAFEATRAMMEELKRTAPFWKKEQTKEGGRWVEKNTPGY